MKKFFLWGLVIVAVVVYLATQFTFGFVPLFIILCFFITYPLFEKRNADIEEHKSYRGTKYMLLVLGFGFLTLFAFNNYVHPDKKVYKNSDHHALRVDGLLIKDWKNYLLAGNSKDAFFDEKFHRGAVVIEDTVVIDSLRSGVRIKCANFAEPIYLISGGNMRRFKMVGDTSAFASFCDKDTVEFIKNTPQGRLVNRMVILPGHENCPQWKFWKKDRDTARYIFNDGVESIEHRFIKKGMPLSDLMAGVVPEFDPNGIFIFRKQFDYDTKLRDIDTYFAQEEYYIGFTAEADFDEIRINGVSTPRIQSYSADIPFGQPFSIGFGTRKSETMCFGQYDGKITLEYYLPKYRSLASNTETDDQTLMVATSLFDGAEDKLRDAYSENIALYDVFARADNKNQMRPWYLSFKSGQSDTPMNFTVYSDSTRHNCLALDVLAQRSAIPWQTFNSHKTCCEARYESYFKGVKTAGNSAQWLVGVENFKNTTPFTAEMLAWTLIAVIILSAISIRIGTRTKKSTKELLTGAEYAAYLILIAFLSVRLFLLWRVTVFPPISSISYFEFNHLRESHYYTDLLYVIGVFYAFVIGFKIFLLKRGPSSKRSNRTISILPSLEEQLGPAKKVRRKSKFGPILDSVRQFFSGIKESRFCIFVLQHKEWFFLVPIVVPYLFIFPFANGEGTFARMMNILFPVTIFFVLEFLIYSIFGLSYLDDIDEDEKISSKDSSIERRRVPVLLSLANILFAAGYTFLKDSGFGVMFVLFGSLLSALLIGDIRSNDKNNTHSMKMVWVRVALYVIVLLFGALYMRFFVWALDYTLVFCIGLVIAFCLVLYLLTVYLEAKPKAWRWALYFAIIVSVGGFAYWYATKQMPKSHMEYRTRVHMASPSDILSNNIDDHVSQNKFMQASLNDFILEEYSSVGESVKPFVGKTEYFKIQPQSKLGAMWFAQTTDIVLSRYIIAEHSRRLTRLLVIALFLFLVVALFERCDHRSHRVVQIGIPLLLFIQAGLIYFANTRLFIFFGQDFPLISITSRLSTIYFFVLLGVFLLSVFWERNHIVGGAQGKEMSDEQQKAFRKYNWRTAIKLVFAAGLIILPPVGVSFFKSYKSEKGGVYTLDSLMVTVRHVTDSLNVVFADYQKKNIIPEIKSDMSAEMKKFKEDSTYIRFIEGEKQLESTKFAVRVIERFMEKGCHRNSAKDLIHLRKRRQYDQKGKPHDILEFDVYQRVFEYHMPKKEGLVWKGSIIGDGLMPESSLNRTTSGNLTMVRLKKDWLNNQAGDLSLVNIATSGKARIMGESSIVDIYPSGIPTVVVSGKDKVLRDEAVRNPNYRNRIEIVARDVPVEILPRHNYFARNVMVNGSRTFLYPMGSQLFWMREFAQQIKFSKESIYSVGGKKASQAEKEGFDHDVPVTISESLSRKIYEIYMNAATYPNDRSVVVADGNGRIKAMVDFRGDKAYRLNPNDESKISRLIDSIDINGLNRSPEEQRFFSTYATNPLRLGPGSSQKPITWTAVTTGYNTDFWNSLAIEIPRNAENDYLKLKNGKYYYLFPHFAGQKIQKAFQSLAGDEGKVNSGNVPITLEWYMYKSSNYYNAMMAFFGLYTKDQLESLLPARIPETAKQNSLVKQAIGNDLKDLFPIMTAKYGQGYNRFSFAQIPSYSDYTNTNGLLASGLAGNFGLTQKPETKIGLYPGVKRYVKNKSTGKVEERASYRQSSFFNMGVRKKEKSARAMLEVGVRTVAIGHSTSWAVSPVKMAEMQGRLITLNKNYTLSLDPSSTNTYQLFDFDSSWGGQLDNREAYRAAYQKTRKSLLYGMSNVFSAGAGGTAHGVSTNFQALNIALDNKDNKVGSYYVYGKTGTIDGKQNDQSHEDHLLAVIITNKKISTATAEELAKVKFYVLYFADYDYDKGRSWKDVDGKVINAVINSAEFKNYMQN